MSDAVGIDDGGERLTTVFRALGNRERLAVVAALAARDEALNISQVCAATDLPRLAVTRHLKNLRIAGVVQSRWERPAHIHWLDVRTVEEIEDWVYATLPGLQLVEHIDAR